MNSYMNESKKIFKYERNIPLGKYKFKNINLFINFIKLLNDKIRSEIILFEAELVNDFGILRFNNLDDLLREIKSSELVFCINIKIFDEKNINSLIINYEQFDGIKHYSFIKLLSNDNNWIKETEEEILEYLSLHKNPLSIFLRPIMSLSLVGVVSSIILFCFYRLFLSINIFQTKPTSKDNIIVIFVTLLTFAILKILQLVLLPTFKIKTEGNFYKKLKSIYKRKIEDIIIGIIIGLVFFLLGKIS